jgi:hypothetical protein
MSGIFGGVTSAQATANFQANMSAMRCLTRHVNAVPVETLDGELVAALCLDCDAQLPPVWAPAPPEPERDYEAEHQKDHHGYWSVWLVACRLCDEEWSA